MAKALLVMIAPHRNALAKGVMQSRADMMRDGSDGMDGTDGTDGMDGADGEDVGEGAECTVPVRSISVDGTPPSPGDKVNFSVEGVVSGIQDGMATVDIKTIDGEVAGNYGGESAMGDQGSLSGNAPGRGESLSQMGSRLRRKAASTGGGY